MSKTTVSTAKKKRKASRAKKVGLPAGSLVYFGEKEKPLNIEVITYNESSCQFKKVFSAADALNTIGDGYITWLNVNGLNNIEEVKKLGAYTQLNNLLLEDVLDTEHRPKVEILDNHILVIIKMLYYGKDGQLLSEHLALLLGSNYLITFQESEGEDVFEPVRKRLQNAETSFRKRNTDYLLFGLLDAIVDNYFVILDKVTERIEVIEDEIIVHPKEDMISEIQFLKKTAIFLQKSIIPSREVVNKIEKSPHWLIEVDTKHYFRDLHDHTVQIVETLVTYRDILWGLTDTYMGAMSNKMNNIMRLLTLISTIFIPLTFIVGVYGMNFKYMPELELWWAYPLVWGIMLSISVAMIFYFKQKKWF